MSGTRRSDAAQGTRGEDLSFKRTRNVKEQAIGAFLFLCAAVSTLVTVGIVAVLLTETISFFRISS